MREGDGDRVLTGWAAGAVETTAAGGESLHEGGTWHATGTCLGCCYMGYMASCFLHGLGTQRPAD